MAQEVVGIVLLGLQLIVKSVVTVGNCFGRDLKQWTPEGAEEPIYTCHDCLVKRGVRFCHDCGAVVEKNSLFMNYCIEHGNLGIKRAMDREFINDYHNFSYFKKHLLPEDNKDSLLLGVELEVDQEEDEDRPQYDTLLEMRKMPCVADFQNDGSLEEALR